MGRPPCCDKIGIKKGPWTPEEDIILVSYIQEHGPGNWRSVPTNTGLMRCSKSCRLRWTNYLRPGIKRGNFTDHEEKMIIHLQALLGNRWAAIASYLPQRTDNDIKNYWNTHLRKKLKKMQNGDDDDISSNNDDEKGNNDSCNSSQMKGQWERRLQTDIHMAKQALCEALSLDKPTQIFPETKLPSTTTKTTATPNQQSTSLYASSTENIARLLEDWMKKSPNTTTVTTETKPFISNNYMVVASSSSDEGTTQSTITCAHDHHALDSLWSFNSERSSTQSEENTTQVPLMLLENWLFDDAAAVPQCNNEDLINMSLEESTEGLF